MMTMTKTTAVGFAAATMLAVGAAPAFAAESISGSTWHLIGDTEVTFTIDGTSFAGSDSCNNIQGTVQHVGDDPETLDFGDSYASTLMACPPEKQSAVLATGQALTGIRGVDWTDENTIALIDPSTGQSWEFVR